MPSEQVKDVCLLCLNVGSTIGVVLVNKLVMQSFPYAMALTCSHQIVAGAILSVRAGGLRPKKTMPFWADAWWSFLAVACIYAQNMSLRLNTVPVYQTAKLMGIPTQCLWQYLTTGKVYSAWVYGSMLVLTFGVGLSTVASLELNANVQGVSAAALAVFVVVLEQSETARLKTLFEMDSMSFLHSNSFHRIFGSAGLILLMEIDALSALGNMTGYAAMMLFISCLFATSINITVVSIIGKFGPVTVAVLGHLKTVSIVSLGFLLRPPAVDIVLAKNVAGISVALTGAIKYGQYTSFPEVDCCDSMLGNRTKTFQDVERDLDATAGEEKAASNEELQFLSVEADPSEEMVQEFDCEVVGRRRV